MLILVQFYLGTGPLSLHRESQASFLMHFTTSTRISVCTQTHTEGCLQYASKAPSQLANAKFLPNKYRNKCINTCLMRCRHFLCISDWIPPTTTLSSIVNEPERQVSDSNPPHSLPTVQSTYNILLPCLGALTEGLLLSLVHSFPLARFHHLCTRGPGPLC